VFIGKVIDQNSLLNYVGRGTARSPLEIYWHPLPRLKTIALHSAHQGRLQNMYQSVGKANNLLVLFRLLTMRC